MMKSSLLIALSLLFCLLADLSRAAHASQDEEPSSAVDAVPEIMDARTGEIVDIETMVNDLMNTDVVFLGEQHDNDAGHEFQLEVIRILIERGADVVISMEQFERDVQGVLDDYLTDRIAEEQFLAHSRPWNNYTDHYRPIIELAKQHDLPVIAGNVPRRLARDISQGKSTNQSDAVFLPRMTSAPEGAYWENFQAVMRGHGGLDDGAKLKPFYESQCLKDDAMAEAISDYVQKNPHARRIIVHLCGHFHSDYGLGTAARVVQRLPLHRISVVTMETVGEDGKTDIESVRSRGHFIFWTVPNSSNEQPDDE